MGELLRRLAAGTAIAAISGTAFGADFGDRHDWRIEAQLGLPSADSDLETWTEGGLGKLRFPSSDTGLQGNRIFVEYRGQIATTLWSRAVLDYVDGPSSGLGFTELYLDFRPVPKSASQHQFRFGAFYPPFSLENGDSGWTSPFTTSFSTINSWYGEEIRPLGAEWTLRRRLGLSPHELAVFAAGFYGNDSAGTLLFWRGFAVHDRQTRFNDRLSMPPGPVVTPDGTLLGFAPQQVEPIAEIDGTPGYYAGLEWRYARRALVSWAIYDNRADPYAFGGGQWAWDTRFYNLAAQLSVTPKIGLVAQWMRGTTEWLVMANRDGAVTPITFLAEDHFDAQFMLFTRQVAGRQRVTLRYDRFEMKRPGVFTSDSGHAVTLAYEYAHSNRLSAVIEYLRIDSSRDLWTWFYDTPQQNTERQLRLQFNLRLLAPAARQE